jgi:predicted TIM-barrel fold metal-dependent hydrolase
VIVDSLTFAGDGLLGALDEAGIDRAIVCAPRARGHGYDIANERAAALARAHPERLVAFARVDPLAPGAASHVEGARGLFLHPWEDAFRITDPAVDALVDGHGSVIVATGYPFVAEALQVAELARRHPETTFVATNGGQINISGLGQEDAFLALEACSNLLVQTSGVYREDFLEGVVERFGAGRLLYASAFPQFDPRLELLRVRWAPKFDERARTAILAGNATRLLLGETDPD